MPKHHRPCGGFLRALRKPIAGLCWLTLRLPTCLHAYMPTCLHAYDRLCSRARFMLRRVKCCTKAPRTKDQRAKDLRHLRPLHGKPFFTSFRIPCAALPLNATCNAFRSFGVILVLAALDACSLLPRSTLVWQHARCTPMAHLYAVRFRISALVKASMWHLASKCSRCSRCAADML